MTDATFLENSRMNFNRKRASGFTLIEIMVVVTIIAVLGAIAYPTYQDSVRKGRRAQATADLGELAQALERHFTVNNTYANYVIAAPLNRSPRQGDLFYNISYVAAPTRTAYSIRAVPAGPQAADRCGTLTLTNTGVKSVSSSTVADCW